MSGTRFWWISFVLFPILSQAAPGQEPIPAVQIVTAHTDRVFAVAFSSGSVWAASGSFDGTVRFWRVDREKGLLVAGPVLDAGGPVLDVDFGHDDGTLLVSFEDGRVRGWSLDWTNPDGPGARREWETELEPSRISLSPTGKDGFTLNSWGLGYYLEFERLGEGARPAAHLHHGDEKAVAARYSPDGTWIASSNDKDLRLWRVDAASGKPPVETAILTGHANYDDVAGVTSDGRWVLSVSHWKDRPLRLWRVDLGGEPVASQLEVGTTEPRSFSTSGYIHRQALLAPSGRWAFVHVSQDGTAGEIQVWALDLSGDGNAKLAAVLGGHTGQIDSIALDAGEEWLLSGASDDTVRLWRVPPR